MKRNVLKVVSGWSIAIAMAFGLVGCGGGSGGGATGTSAGCVFRCKSAADSDPSRPPIPIQVGHLFRLIPATP